MIWRNMADVKPVSCPRLRYSLFVCDAPIIHTWRSIFYASCHVFLNLLCLWHFAIFYKINDRLWRSFCVINEVDIAVRQTTCIKYTYFDVVTYNKPLAANVDQNVSRNHETINKKNAGFLYSMSDSSFAVARHWKTVTLKVKFTLLKILYLLPIIVFIMIDCADWNRIKKIAELNKTPEYTLKLCTFTTLIIELDMRNISIPCFLLIHFFVYWTAWSFDVSCMLKVNDRNEHNKWIRHITSYNKLL